ncbi:MAG: DUF2711 domain-containing protein [Chitinophagales bacterium]|nr:DUF2711 domain-containing protein [Chitinophagales bacterium]
MSNFLNKPLHPGRDTTILEYFSAFFDAVFISFSPFFKLKETPYSNKGYKNVEQISLEELREKDPLFEKIPQSNADIFSFDNEDYPSDDEIFEQGESISWQEIKKACNFGQVDEINKALKTSIGAYRPVFNRMDLANKLSDYALSNQLYFPESGAFNVLSKKQIYRSFKFLGIHQLTIEQEFSQGHKTIHLEQFTEKEFCNTIAYKDYYIYDTNKKLLFAIDWDNFFFLICADRKTIETLVENMEFEGFYCDEHTRGNWELTPEEIKAGLHRAQSDTPDPSRQIKRNGKDFLEADNYRKLKLLRYDREDPQTERFYFAEMSTLQASLLFPEELKLLGLKIAGFDEQENFFDEKELPHFHNISDFNHYFLQNPNYRLQDCELEMEQGIKLESHDDGEVTISFPLDSNLKEPLILSIFKKYKLNLNIKQFIEEKSGFYVRIDSDGNIESYSRDFDKYL